MLINDPTQLDSQPGLQHHAYAFIGGGSTEQPAPLDYTKLLDQTLTGYQNTAGGFYDLESQYQPLYGQLGLNSAAQMQEGYTSADGVYHPGTLALAAQQQQGYTDANGVYHPGTLALGQEAATSNRGATLSDLNQFGASTTASLLGTNPYLGYGLDSLSDATYQAGQQSPIQRTLNQQAQEQLAQQGQLSPEAARDLSQATQAGFASRGINNGNSSMAADLFARQGAVDQRMAAAQQFATGVQGLNFNQIGQYGSLSGSLANTASQTVTNPVLQSLGFGNLNPGYSGSTGSAGGSVAIPQVGTNSLFPTNSSSAADIYGTNFNAQSAAAISAANNQAALQAAGLNAAGSIAGGFLSDKRLKTDIKKVGKSKSGIPEYEYSYKTDRLKRRYRGAMAQDLEKLRPSAVVEDPITGLKAVDYRQIDVDFQQLNPYRKAA